MSDWISKALRVSQQKKQREKLHYSVTEWYQQVRDAGYDHDEARELMRGILLSSNPSIVPLVMLWIEREHDK